jgi:hypothetical protein
MRGHRFRCRALLLTALLAACGGAVAQPAAAAAGLDLYVLHLHRVELLPAVEATLSLNTHWRTSRRDGVHGAGGGVIRAAGASRARHVGDSIDVIVIWAINRMPPSM